MVVIYFLEVVHSLVQELVVVYFFCGVLELKEYAGLGLLLGYVSSLVFAVELGRGVERGLGVRVRGVRLGGAGVGAGDWLYVEFGLFGLHDSVVSRG